MTTEEEQKAISEAGAVLREGGLMDLVNAFDVHTRKLFPDLHAGLHRLASAHFPEKLQIAVLQEVFAVFLTSTQRATGRSKPVDLAFHRLGPDFEQGQETDVHFSRPFEFDNRSWTGTVTHHITAYAGDLTYFIRIRLPFDGYLFSQEHAEDGEEGDGVTLSAMNEDAYALVANVLQSLMKLNPQGFRLTGEVEGEIIPMYNAARRQVEIKFHDTASRKCFAVVWEHGLCNNEPRYPQANSRFAQLAAKYCKAPLEASS